MFTMRFDMRAKDGAESAAALYQAAIEMAEWGEGKGCVAVQVSEHHASEDGYLPTPIVLASAIAARTRNLPIQVAALIAPLHDPIELAEQMAVLDLVSQGRVSYVCAVGYRPEEYAMFGQDLKTRGQRIEEMILTMQKAWKGEPFEYEGRPVCVTPRPASPGGPTLLLGGNAKVVVRRAARLGLGMITQGGDPSLEEVYRAACEEYGTEPAMFVNPVGDLPMSAFVAEDPDAAWQEIGPYLLHDAQMYAKWFGDAGSITKASAATVDELRAEKGSYRIFSVDEAIDFIQSNGMMALQPLCGGIPPEIAWKHVKLVAEKVLPATR